MNATKELSQRLATVRSRCAAAGAPDITIVGVTKGHDASTIAAAVSVGLGAIGESYAQELLAKHTELGDSPPDPWPEVHFIGRLQRNKVRRLAGIVDVWQSVDRPDLVDELEARAPGSTVMVQVDLSGDPGKGGCRPRDAPGLVRAARDAGLHVRGLMGVGPLGEPEEARDGFRLLRGLVDELGLDDCSMGMSADMDVAIEEGSTMLRIGTALFGPRTARG